MKPDRFNFLAIGIAYTCYKEKFCIPRQSGLAPSSTGYIDLVHPYNQHEALKGLDTFSHLIITFVPHLNTPNASISVRPPRLGGTDKLGVFATKSPFRPNPICSSVVKVDSIDFLKGKIHFSNHDILNESPILDIKPYIRDWDSYPKANNGWIDEHPEGKIAVKFSDDISLKEELRNLIIETLSLNPRPRSQKSKTSFAVRLENADISFEYLDDKTISVRKILFNI